MTLCMQESHHPLVQCHLNIWKTMVRWTWKIKSDNFPVAWRTSTTILSIIRSFSDSIFHFFHFMCFCISHPQTWNYFLIPFVHRWFHWNWSNNQRWGKWKWRKWEKYGTQLCELFTIWPCTWNSLRNKCTTSLYGCKVGKKLAKFCKSCFPRPSYSSWGVLVCSVPA